LRRQSKHAPKNSVFSPDACADTYYVLALLLQQLLCSWIEQRKRNGARFTLTVAAALLMSHQIIEKKSWFEYVEAPAPPITAIRKKYTWLQYEEPPIQAPGTAFSNLG